MIQAVSIFFNETDLLDLKVSEMKGHVDRIIIVESPWTFRGNYKGLAFPAKKYENDPEIKYLMVGGTDYEHCKHPRDREEVQRNYAQSLIGMKDNDILIITDLDEIVDGRRIDDIVRHTKKYEFVSLQMRCFYYFINCYSGLWHSAFSATGKICKKYTFEHLRRRAGGLKGYEHIPEPKLIADCGFHFSFLGDPESITKKIRSFSAEEYDKKEFTDLRKIKKRMDNLIDLFDRRRDGKNIDRFKIVDIDPSYPETILKNLEKWKRYIR